MSERVRTRHSSARKRQEGSEAEEHGPAHEGSAELPAEAQASALSRFTASRVLDPQIELTREGLRHTQARGAGVGGQKSAPPREVAAIGHPAPMIELLGLLLATPRQRPPTGDPGAEPSTGVAGEERFRAVLGGLHHVYERGA